VAGAGQAGSDSLRLAGAADAARAACSLEEQVRGGGEELGHGAAHRGLLLTRRARNASGTATQSTRTNDAPASRRRRRARSTTPCPPPSALRGKRSTGSAISLAARPKHVQAGCEGGRARTVVDGVEVVVLVVPAERREQHAEVQPRGHDAAQPLATPHLRRGAGRNSGGVGTTTRPSGQASSSSSH
jgi:hypothetical protein